ncbi:MAG: hypothetical protein FWD49_03870 [Firmicutes bacterium]|nr:hypothetical protein [Bacillota bacterium]
MGWIACVHIDIPPPACLWQAGGGMGAVRVLSCAVGLTHGYAYPAHCGAVTDISTTRTYQ